MLTGCWRSLPDFPMYDLDPVSEGLNVRVADVFRATFGWARSYAFRRRTSSLGGCTAGGSKPRLRLTMPTTIQRSRYEIVIYVASMELLYVVFHCINRAS